MELQLSAKYSIAYPENVD